MYVLVNPRKGSMVDPVSVITMKGTMGVDNYPLLLSEDTLQVEKCDLLDFKRKVGDCSTTRNVVLMDDFYAVQGDNPYKDIASPIFCGDNLLAILASEGKCFTVAGKQYKLEARGSDVYLNDESLLEIPAPGTIIDLHLMYPFQYKTTLYMRYIALTDNHRAGMLTLIFNTDGEFLDAVGYGACPRSPKENVGRVRAFTDGSARY